jgi:hypothetical protein
MTGAVANSIAWAMPVSEPNSSALRPTPPLMAPALRILTVLSPVIGHSPIVRTRRRA